MQRDNTSLFNNLPIHHKLRTISAIPLASLILVSLVTLNNVQTFSEAEERLNNLYLTQKTAAEYMRLVVDLETGFRGYVLTENEDDLEPYQNALTNIRVIEKELNNRLVEGHQTDIQEHEFKNLQVLVNQLMAEKELLIRDIRAGRKPVSLRYIQDGRGRALMSEVRALVARLDQRERASTVEELSKMNTDRLSTLLAILGGGLFTCFLIGFGNYAIAKSIAAPLVTLSRAVGSPSVGSVPTIPVLDRKDEIGGLSRVMQQMNLQIQRALDELHQSADSLRTLNQNLSASEAKYRSLVDHAPIGIFMMRENQVLFSNRHNQMLAGFDPDKEIDPGSFRKRIHPEDSDRVMSDFLRAITERHPCEMIFRFVHSDGGTRNILSRLVPIRDLSVPGPMYIGFNIDITALHNLEVHLSRSEKLATLGQVAAGIAHELRNPLVGIGSTASLLLDDFEHSDPRRAEIEVILQESKRMDRIVNQIVDYARPRGLVPKRFRFSDLIHDTLRAMSGPLQEDNVRIKTSLSLTNDHLHADQDQIKQVLINVISNAIDASPSDGAVIEITAHEVSQQDKTGISIRILDTGRGIPPEALSRVFEPFFTSGKRRGTGLGMAICKNIVEAHHGDIFVTSEVGRGTVVSIWLPLSQDPESETN